MISLMAGGSRTLVESVDEAVRRLINVEHFRAGSIVALPLTYPSGDTVVLEVAAQAGRCFVSDRGGAYQDAELYGSSRYFRPEAMRVAENAGIRFDGRDIFTAEVPQERLRGAMMTVGNCSALAAQLAAYRLAERADRDARDDLYLRLSSVYAHRDVQKDPEFRGATTKWRVSVAVLDRPKPAFFEPVSGIYISAVGTAAKFNDFAGLETAPDRFGVIKSREDLGDFYGLVARASSKLVPITAADQTFIELLEAA